MFAVILAILGVFFFFKTRDLFDGEAPRPPITHQLQPHLGSNSKHSKLSMQEQRDQYYATVRKLSTQSPCNDPNALERIPEYSEDIYPYATFHLKDQEKPVCRPSGTLIYDSREGMAAKKARSSSGNVGTGQRLRKKSKKPNTESEEYDSLNSDSDSRELDATSRTESSNCLDEPANFGILIYHSLE